MTDPTTFTGPEHFETDLTRAIAAVWAALTTGQNSGRKRLARYAFDQVIEALIGEHKLTDAEIRTIVRGQLGDESPTGRNPSPPPPYQWPAPQGERTEKPADGGHAHGGTPRCGLCKDSGLRPSARRGERVLCECGAAGKIVAKAAAENACRTYGQWPCEGHNPAPGEFVEQCGVIFHHPQRSESTHCIAGAPDHEGPHVNPYEAKPCHCGSRHADDCPLR